MARHMSDYRALRLLALLFLGTTIGDARAGWFTRGCAARDLELLMLIEDRESSTAVSADKLNDALISMLEARIVCHEGRVMDAIALYDNIARSIAADAVATSAEPR